MHMHMHMHMHICTCTYAYTYAYAWICFLWPVFLAKVHDLLHARYEPLCALFAYFCRSPGGGDGGEGGANADEAEPLRMNRFEWIAFCRDVKALQKTFSSAKVRVRLRLNPNPSPDPHPYPSTQR